MAKEDRGLAESLLQTEEGKRIADKREQLSRLAEGQDGRTILEQLKKREIASSLEKRDMAQAKSDIEAVLQTDAGKRFIAEINKLMNR